MSAIFLKLLNISITAGWIVLAVVLLRFFLRKAPKWISCVLWAIVALRLLIPFHFESHLSILPSAEVIPQDIATSTTPAINSGIPVVNSVVNPVLEEQAPAAFNLEVLLQWAAILWLVGMAVLFLYGIISSLVLHLRVRASVKLQDRVYECDYVDFPFVLGIVNPKIYIPSGMKPEQVEYVLAHEYVHLKRFDHLWKPLGYLLMSIYWFNPLLWGAYILLARDIEQACDEKVIKSMDNSQKKGYSIALAECGTQRRMVTLCPVAFGEVSVKTRIKGVLNYKKPTFWIIMVSIVACAVASVCLLTDPFPCIHDYQMQIVDDATCTEQGKECYTCTKCEHCYFKSTAICAHSYGEGVVLKQPTCAEVGYLRKTCSDCGAITTEQIQKLAHTPGEVTVTKAPNCTQQGEGTTPCTVCGTVFTVSIATNDDHDLKETVVKAATCEEAGEGLLTCTHCSYEQKCTYEQLDHHYEYSYILEKSKSSCTWIVTCPHCGDIEIAVTYNKGKKTSKSPSFPKATWPGQSTCPIVIWDPNN